MKTPINYTLIRSARRTLGLEVRRDLTVVVRAPLRCSQAAIDRFVSKNSEWIARQLEKQGSRPPTRPEPTEEDRKAMIARAKEVIPERVEYYAAVMGVKPTGITITGAQKRYGSCSAKNRLCFTWRLMAYPLEAIDSVVVHELAHIIHKNHGKDFYTLVESVLPDYRQRKKLLEE